MIFLKVTIPDKWAMSLEFLVGIMLVYFGLSAIYSKNPNLEHHEEIAKVKGKYSYRKSIFMGFIHGLAGSAAMILLTIGTVNNALDGALYILVFGAGTIISMLMFSTLNGIPFVMGKSRMEINKLLV